VSWLPEHVHLVSESSPGSASSANPSEEIISGSDS
jgi:hypothetical protein